MRVVSVAGKLVSTGRERRRLGPRVRSWEKMHGSPTLLVNGKDPFDPPDASPAIACRMYRGEDGRLEGAPTLTALRLVLEEAGGGEG